MLLVGVVFFSSADFKRRGDLNQSSTLWEKSGITMSYKLRSSGQDVMFIEETISPIFDKSCSTIWSNRK